MSYVTVEMRINTGYVLFDCTGTINTDYVLLTADVQFMVCVYVVWSAEMPPSIHLRPSIKQVEGRYLYRITASHVITAKPISVGQASLSAQQQSTRGLFYRASSS